MNIEQVPELYGNHLESGTSVAFHAKNTDTLILEILQLEQLTRILQ